MRLTCFIFNLLFVSISLSQNWNLLDANKTYFFKHIDSLYITNTIKIDSAVTSGSDIDFHVHTTIKICDTCTVIPPNALDGILYHAYWPEIFGLTPTQANTNNEFIFQDGTIKHHAEIMDSWIFNSTAGINASVVDKYETTLFGLLDSVKIIELSTLDTILISKNHGVIRYPDFENPGKYFLQVGYHEQQNSFGEYLPNMWRIYDFEVGDVFYFSHYHSYITGDADMCYSGINSKFSVLSNASTANTINYVFAQTQNTYSGCVSTGNSAEDTGSGTVNYTMDSTRAYYENHFSGITKISIDPEFWAYDPFYNNQYNSFLADSYPILDTSIRRNFIQHKFENNGYTKFIQSMNKFNDSLYFINSTADNEIRMEYREGFGRRYFEIYQFEENHTDELIAWIIDGDTTGILFQFANTPELQKPVVQIYPNPASSKINIPANLSIISIYSVSGQLILQLENPGHIISIENLPEGIYFVNMIDQNNHHLFSKLLVE